MKVIVAGTRTFNDYRFLEKKLDDLFSVKRPTHIVCGLAKGADALGEKYAKEHGIELEYYPANWDEEGKSAGFKRNERMALAATHCVVFWDGVSKGSKHMIDLAGKHGLIVRVIRY